MYLIQFQNKIYQNYIAILQHIFHHQLQPQLQKLIIIIHYTKEILSLFLSILITKGH